MLTKSLATLTEQRSVLCSWVVTGFVVSQYFCDLNLFKGTTMNREKFKNAMALPDKKLKNKSLHGKYLQRILGLAKTNPRSN
jgi:hypothetical protein